MLYKHSIGINSLSCQPSGRRYFWKDGAGKAWEGVKQTIEHLENASFILLMPWGKELGIV